MGTIESHTNSQLQIDFVREDSTITLRFLGKSILKDPNDFLMPILLKALTESNNEKKRLVLDFGSLAYMNSSTLTPVIKILERARVGEGQISVSYRRMLKWQDISFSALVIFQTPDKRIEIKGID